MDQYDKIIDNSNLVFERDVSFRTSLNKHARSFNEPIPLERASFMSKQGTFPTFNPIMMP